MPIASECKSLLTTQFSATNASLHSTCPFDWFTVIHWHCSVFPKGSVDVIMKFSCIITILFFFRFRKTTGLMEEVQLGSRTRVSSEFSGQLNMVFWPFPSFLLKSIVLILQAWFNRKISFPVHVRWQQSNLPVCVDCLLPGEKGRILGRNDDPNIRSGTSCLPFK